MLLTIINFSFSNEQYTVKAQIITEGETLHFTPEFNSAYSGAAYLNSKVTILAKTDWLECLYPWYFVSNGNETGWIHGSKIIFLEENSSTQQIEIDNQYNHMKFQILISEFTNFPFKNDFSIPPLEITDPESLISKYGTELQVTNKSSEDKHDNSVQILQKTLASNEIEIKYSRGKNGSFYLDLFRIKSLQLINSQLATVSTSEKLIEILGEPRRSTFYNGKRIFFYMDRIGNQLQFRYENNIFVDVTIIYYEE